MNLTGLYNGIVNLGTRVLDLDELKIRKRTTDEDVETYYRACIERIGERCRDYFEDQEAFDTVLNELLNGKRPELIAREPVYPNPLNLAHSRRSLEAMLDPRKRIKDKCFYAPHLMIPLPISEDSPFSKLVDKSDDLDLVSKGTPPRIEIPNDRSQPYAEGATTHETLHYFIIQYQLASGRLFTDGKEFDSKEQRDLVEKFIHERAVEELTDVLLEDNEDALFEDRWGRYRLMHYTPDMGKMASSFLTPLIAVGCITYDKPELLPLALIPGALRRIFSKRRRNRIKEELVKPVERKVFKI